jgi:alpha-1,3-fucosyltransferase
MVATYSKLHKSIEFPKRSVKLQLSFLISGEKHANITKYKSRFAAWFVSNCNDAPSNRHKLVEKLQEFIQVDIFGKCGTACPPYPKKCASLDSYWFYFSFENSICQDYVTEKVFKIFNQNAVPVVFNGADMNRFLPPHSYIEANAFETAEDLAKYLIHLKENPTEYLQYFWWTKKYEVFQWSRVEKSRICDALNKREGRKIYHNMTAWFRQGCMEPHIKF